MNYVKKEKQEIKKKKKKIRNKKNNHFSESFWKKALAKIIFHLKISGFIF